MSQDKYFHVVLSINEDVTSASFIFLHDDNIEDSEKEEIVTNIELEAIIPSIKKNFSHQRMVDFMYNLELRDQKCDTKVIVRY